MKSSTAFLRDLSASRRRVNDFASMHAGRGVSIWMPPEETRPTEEDRFEYSDSGDLMVMLRVEHKVRGFSFTCRDDFPYPTVIVDEVYKEDKKASEDGPLGMCIIESSDNACAAVVYGWTVPKWRVESKWDAAQGRQCEFYTVAKTLVRFCRPEDVF